MGSSTGILPIVTYAQPVGDSIDQLLAIIPNPDTSATSGAQAGGGFLDQMSPAAAVQLRVELEALKGVLDAGGDDATYGSHTITAGEATANLVDIVTGLADTALGKFAVSVWNGTTLATSDAVITEPTPGTIRIADGSTYNTVAGYVVIWAAIDPSA